MSGTDRPARPAGQVPDLQMVHHDLVAKGVVFLAPPLLITAGPLEGCSFVYFKDPNGVTLELFQSAGAHH